MIRAQSITKVYAKEGKEIVALSRVSFDINKGEFISIVGPSGSGKSSLLLMLGGMLTPTEGEVWIDGESLFALTAKQRALLRRTKIGFLFQTFHLIPYLTALQNVKVPLLLNGLSEKEQELRATRVLERVGLQERLHHLPQELSIGQQQRLALARMLANDPALILADEPTGNLDPDTSAQMMHFLQELHREGKTLVMVTHDMHIADQTSRTLRINGQSQLEIPS